MDKVTVVVTGGFDPLHVGHLNHLEKARTMGDRLVVILQSDRNLVAKKGYVFMPYRDRMRIMKALRCVDLVVPNIDEDGSSAETLRQLALGPLHPDILAKGGDRVPGNMPAQEIAACKEINCRIVYGIGGQLASSQELVNRALGVLKP